MTTKYKDINISYSVYGEGDTIVLLHGFLENSSMWKNIIPELSKNNKVITIDLLGHGKTDFFGYIHSMETLAETVYSVISQLKVDRFKIVGHSLGGYVALAFAEKFNKYLSGICLVNSTTNPDDETRISIRNRSIKTAKTHYSQLISMSISNLFHVDSKSLFQEDIENLKAEALQTPVQGYINTQEGMKIRTNRTEILKRFNKKKLLIAGSNDPVVPLSNLKEIAQDCNCELTVFNGGHMSQIENAPELTEALVNFCSK